MRLGVLYRIRASPEAHLGRRSLARLGTFETRVRFVCGEHCGGGLRIRRSARLGPGPLWTCRGERQGRNTGSADVSQDDEQAFELFFAALDAAIAAHADRLVAREPRPLTDDPPPASAFLDVLAERPGMFLRRASVGCLRAFLDGYSLAAIEQGHPECADLDGFEHWARRRLGLRGYFRWENAILTLNNGDEAAALGWALRELEAYRATKDPPSHRRYKVVPIEAPTQAAETDPGIV